MGKTQLIKGIEGYLKDNPEVTEILFYGIIDKDIVDIICQSTKESKNSLLFKIVLPKLKDFRQLNWLKNYTNKDRRFEVKSNPKCCSQFMIINKAFVFISGNGKITSDSFLETGLSLIEEENIAGCDELKAIFTANWNNGFHLKLG